MVLLRFCGQVLFVLWLVILSVVVMILVGRDAFSICFGEASSIV